MTSEEKTYLDLFAKIDGRQVKIGYGLAIEKDTVLCKADGHLNAQKIGKALMEGITLQLRPWKKPGIKNKEWAFLAHDSALKWLLQGRVFNKIEVHITQSYR